jgi:hypothetical protein
MKLKCVLELVFVLESSYSVHPSGQASFKNCGCTGYGLSFTIHVPYVTINSYPSWFLYLTSILLCRWRACCYFSAHSFDLHRLSLHSFHLTRLSVHSADLPRLSLHSFHLTRLSIHFSLTRIICYLS